MKRKLKVGLFGIGLDTYWPQFKGLKPRLEGYVRAVEQQLTRPDVEVVNLGLIDNPVKALEAGHQFRMADVDLIFLHVTTYALSSTVLPVVQRAKVPVIILNLAPEAAIDYASFNRMGDRTAMTGEWLAHCAACPVPEIANVFQPGGRAIFTRSPACCTTIRFAGASWTRGLTPARVAHTMFHNRLGLMGHYYCGMLDIYSDTTLQCATFGGHLEIVEVDELAALRREVSAKAIKDRVAHFKRVFDVQSDCSADELSRAARTSVALDRLVQEHDLGSLAYYYMGTGNADNEDAISSIILGNSLLTARGVPVAGEYEVKNAQAMKIMDTFGVGGSFTEYYAMDFKDDVVLMGHDGPGHHQNRRGQNQGPSADRLSRQSGPGTLRGNVGQARPGDLPLGGGDHGREIEAADGRGRIRARSDHGNRQHQQPLPFQPRRAKICRGMESARPGAPLRRRRGAHHGQAREAGPRAGHRDGAGLLTGAQVQSNIIRHLFFRGQNGRAVRSLS